MGILAKSNCEKENILTRNGFEYVGRSVTGDILNCYERCVNLSKGYCAWISINTSGKGMIYIEYDFGGEVERYSIDLSNSWDEDEGAFFNELDEYLTDTTESYR